MATVQQIIDSVKRTFGDESGVQVTDDDIIRWINQGQRQFVMQNESLLFVTSTANAVAGQQTYSLPTNLLVLKGLQFKASNTTQYFPIKGYDLTRFNELVDGWDGATNDSYGAPVMYTVIGSNFVVWPVPRVSDTASFKIYYHRNPQDVTFHVDTPDLPVLYHDLLIKHCIQQAYEMDEDWEAAGNKVSELDRDLNIMRGREEWKVQETYPVINVLSEDC